MKKINFLDRFKRRLFGRKKFQLDFVVVGTQKAGTSALDKYLREHPGIEMPRWKELHFFDNDKAYENKEKRNLKDFYFRNDTSKVYGECTPIYLYWTPSLERLKDHSPGAKIIVILRNPVERAYSHWNMEISRGWEDREFKQCIEEEIAEIKQKVKVQHRVKSYVHRGLYGEQIEKVYSLFPKEQVLFLKYEDFRANQVFTLNEIFSFLGISLIENIPERKSTKIIYKSKITPLEKVQLLDFFEPTIKEVEKLLSWDCSDWRNKN